MMSKIYQESKQAILEWRTIAITLKKELKTVEREVKRLRAENKKLANRNTELEKEKAEIGKVAAEVEPKVALAALGNLELNSRP